MLWGIALILFIVLSFFMQTGKVRIKVNDFEIEVEGTEKFIDAYLEKTLGTSLSQLPFQLENKKGVNKKKQTKIIQNEIKKKQETFASLVKKMKVKNIQDLIIASAYYWSVIKKIKTCPEHDLYKTVTMDKQLFKKYGGNFKEPFSKLIESGKIKKTNGQYELSQELIEEITQKIGKK
jgi:hypothetical protein